MVGGLKLTTALGLLGTLAVPLRGLNIGSSNLDSTSVSRSTDIIVKNVLNYDIMLLQVKGIGMAFLSKLKKAFRAIDAQFELVVDSQRNPFPHQRSLFVYCSDRVSLVDQYDHVSDQPAPPFSVTFSPIGQNKTFSLIAAKLRHLYQFGDLRQLNAAVYHIQAIHGIDHAIAVMGTIYVNEDTAAFRQFSNRKLPLTVIPYGVYQFGNMERAIYPNEGRHKSVNWDSDKKRSGNRLITITEFRIDTHRLSIKANLGVLPDGRWLQGGTSTPTHPWVSATAHAHSVSSINQYTGSSIPSGSYYPAPSTSSLQHATMAHQPQLSSSSVQQPMRQSVYYAAPAGGSRIRHPPVGIASRFKPYKTNDGGTSAVRHEVASDPIQLTMVHSTDRTTNMSSLMQYRGQSLSLHAGHKTVYIQHQHGLVEGNPAAVLTQPSGREQHGEGNIQDETQLLMDFSQWAQLQTDSFLTSLLEPDISPVHNPAGDNILISPEYMSSGYSHQHSPDYGGSSFR